MFKNRLRSFYYAFQGLWFLFLSQTHAKIHFAFTIIVVMLGYYLGVTKTEWIILLFCIGIIWSLEAMNTAVEQIVDLVSPNYHEKAKNAKDVAASAVLIAAMICAFIGMLIFIPYLIKG